MKPTEPIEPTDLNGQAGGSMSETFIAWEQVKNIALLNGITLTDAQRESEFNGVCGWLDQMYEAVAIARASMVPVPEEWKRKRIQ